MELYDDSAHRTLQEGEDAVTINYWIDKAGKLHGPYATHEQGAMELQPAEKVTKMLDGVKRIVDLTGEIGSAIDLTADEEETKVADDLLAQWDEYSA